jgi:phosphatidylethanolamine-binding protein (PEBP) family uncharacterized protein
MGLAIGTYDGKAEMHTARARRRRSSLRGGAIALSCAVLFIALAGCGGAAPPQRAKAARIALTSPALTGSGLGGPIQVRYTCDGADATPPFRWGAVPPNTASLALFLLRVARTQPTAGGSVSAAVNIEWAVAGLSPRIHEIPVGRLPRGAVTGSKRYSICPTRGGAATYIFQLVAMAQQPAVGPHFNATKLFQEAESVSVGRGTLTSSYKRT